MAGDRYVFDGLEGFEKRLRRVAGDVAYLVVWDRTDRNNEDNLGRFELTARDALPYLEGADELVDEQDDDDEAGDLEAAVDDGEDESPERQAERLLGRAPGPADFAVAAGRWLRDIAGRNLGGDVARRFRVRAYTPKGTRVVDTGSFLCRDDDHDAYLPVLVTQAEPVREPEFRIPTPTFDQVEAVASARGMKALGDYYAQFGHIVIGTIGQLQGVNNAMVGRMHRQLDQSREQVDQFVGRHPDREGHRCRARPAAPRGRADRRRPDRARPPGALPARRRRQGVPDREGRHPRDGRHPRRPRPEPRPARGAPGPRRPRPHAGPQPPTPRRRDAQAGRRPGPRDALRPRSAPARQGQLTRPSPPTSAAARPSRRRTPSCRRRTTPRTSRSSTPPARSTPTPSTTGRSATWPLHRGVGRPRRGRAVLRRRAPAVPEPPGPGRRPEAARPSPRPARRGRRGPHHRHRGEPAARARRGPRRRRRPPARARRASPRRGRRARARRPGCLVNAPARRDAPIRVNLTLPVTRIGLGVFSVDPLEQLIGAKVADLLEPLMVGPVERRPSASGAAVDVRVASSCCAASGASLSEKTWEPTNLGHTLGFDLTIA